MTCKCKFNGCGQFEYCCYHNKLINKKSYVTNDQSHINFVMAFKQAYIQYLTEQLQEEAEEATDSDENDEFEETNKNEADQTNPTPLSGPTLKPNPSPLPNQKIKNVKLQNNQINQLQKIRGKRLRQLQEELYEDNVNLINRLDNVNDLNRLFDNINSDQNLMKLKHELKKKQILQNWKSTEILEFKKKCKFKQDIENEAFISNLLAGNLHDILIINDTLLNEEQKEKLHELHKQQIIALSNKIYDELKNNIRNEQIISRLDDKGYYDSIIAAINIETEIKKLQDDWKIKIDAEIDQIFLLPPRSIEKIHQIREVRIATLQKPPKRPSSEDSDEENFPTRLPDNARPVRNANGNINVQISFIVDEYKHTLNANDKKKFNRIKMDYVKKLIKDAHTKSKADDYIWLMSTKKIKGTKCNRLEKDPKYKNPAQYPILFNPEKFSLTNPLGFSEEYIDDEENIKQIIIQFQQSLKNQSEISTDNLKKMLNFLINSIKIYNNDDDKKEYLYKIFKILVTRELDDIKDNNDINNVFDSLNFTF
ncbi:hypothetical protein C2G38_2208841 [Gigaspora rosea]|uniref:Uncharacterized protein n=1 Tax=Gigaspora rosea TaxID=44941 RepID=A0A397UK17_9GLOM|nr:hypothetical protein C2G38_2208841 [Gigaspora rosea]